MEDVGIFFGHLVYFTAIWYIVWPFGILCGHLVNFTVIWYIFPHFGMLCHEKSGNPVLRIEELYKLIRITFRFEVERMYL
jgi:hypothetical protein